MSLLCIDEQHLEAELYLIGLINKMDTLNLLPSNLKLSTSPKTLASMCLKFRHTFRNYQCCLSLRRRKLTNGFQTLKRLESSPTPHCVRRSALIQNSEAREQNFIQNKHLSQSRVRMLKSYLSSKKMRQNRKFEYRYLHWNQD